MALSQIDLWIVGVYLAATLAIGLYFGWQTNSFKEFAIGDRKIGTAALVATMFATYMGAASTLGITEKVFSLGLVFIFICSGDSIYKFTEGFIFKRMDSCLKSSLSSGDIVGHFYGKYGKLIAGIALVITLTGILGLQVKAVGYLFEYFLNMTGTQGIFLGAGLVVIYSSLGGMRAVVATDIFQVAMLAIALPFLALWALWQAGGPEVIREGVPAGHLNFFPHGPDAGEYLSMFALYAFPRMLALSLQRLLMAKSAKQGADAWQITAGVSLVFYSIVGLIGLIAVVMNSGLEPKLAMPWVIQQCTSPGIYGVMVVGLLAVIMSTADSCLHVASISLAHDIIAPFRNEPLASRAELRLAQVSSLLIGSLAICVALWFSDLLSIAITFRFFWALAIPVPLIAAVFGFRASPRTFLLAVAAGVATSVGWGQFAPEGAIGAFVPSILVHTIVFFTARMFDPLHIRIEKKPDGKVVAHSGVEPVSTLSTLRNSEHAWRFAVFSGYVLFFYVFSLFFPGVNKGYAQLTHMGFAMLLVASCVGYLPMFVEAVPRILQPYMHVYWKVAVTLCLPVVSTQSRDVPFRAK